MVFEDKVTRRNFLRYATVGGIALPMLSGIYYPDEAKGVVLKDQVFHFPKDLKNLTADQKEHFPRVTLPPVVEDGSQAPIVVEMDHPMDKDNYIKSIQILNFNDPVVIKGKFYFTPANGEVYIGTQIRLDGGNSTVWVIAECSKHGKFAVSKTVKVAAGGC